MPPMLRAIVVVALIALHVLTSLTLGLVSTDRWPEPATVMYVALVFAQTCLIGIWAGIGRGWLPIRLVGAAIGVGCVFGLMSLFMRTGEEAFYMLGGSAAVAAGALLVSRIWRVQLMRFEQGQQAEAAEGFKFAIRHLLYLTLVVAVLLTVGRALSNYLRWPDDWAFILTICVCFAAIALAAVWASLGMRWVGFRLLVLIALASATGLIPPFASKNSIEYGYIAFPIHTALMGLFVGLTLLVFRWCGYRVVRLPAESPEG